MSLTSSSLCSRRHTGGRAATGTAPLGAPGKLLDPEHVYKSRMEAEAAGNLERQYLPALTVDASPAFIPGEDESAIPVPTEEEPHLIQGNIGRRYSFRLLPFVIEVERDLHFTAYLGQRRWTREELQTAASEGLHMYHLVHVGSDPKARLRMSKNFCFVARAGCVQEALQSDAQLRMDLKRAVLYLKEIGLFSSTTAIPVDERYLNFKEQISDRIHVRRSQPGHNEDDMKTEYLHLSETYLMQYIAGFDRGAHLEEIRLLYWQYMLNRLRFFYSIRPQAVELDIDGLFERAHHHFRRMLENLRRKRALLRAQLPADHVDMADDLPIPSAKEV